MLCLGSVDAICARDRLTLKGKIVFRLSAGQREFHLTARSTPGTAAAITASIRAATADFQPGATAIQACTGPKP